MQTFFKISFGIKLIIDFFMNYLISLIQLMLVLVLEISLLGPNLALISFLIILLQLNITNLIG